VTLINLAIIREPYNWAVVMIVTAFALLALHIVAPQPSSTDDTEN
jgi:hypothetical protein